MSPHRPLIIVALTAITASVVGLAVLLLYRQRRGDARKREDSQSEISGDARKNEDSHQPQQLQQQRVAQRALRQWIAERDVCLPSVAAVLRAINNSRTNKHTLDLLPSEEVCGVLIVTSLISIPAMSQ